MYVIHNIYILLWMDRFSKLLVRSFYSCLIICCLTEHRRYCISHYRWYFLLFSFYTGPVPEPGKWAYQEHHHLQWGHLPWWWWSCLWEVHLPRFNRPWGRSGWCTIRGSWWCWFWTRPVWRWWVSGQNQQFLFVIQGFSFKIIVYYFF